MLAHLANKLDRCYKRRLSIFGKAHSFISIPTHPSHFKNYAISPYPYPYPPHTSISTTPVLIHIYHPSVYPQIPTHIPYPIHIIHPIPHHPFSIHSGQINPHHSMQYGGRGWGVQAISQKILHWFRIINSP